MLANDAINNVIYNGNNWAYNVKSMLDSLSLNYIWDNQDTFENIPFSVIKKRILDIANQELIMSINTSNFKLILALNWIQHTNLILIKSIIRSINLH